MIVSDFRDRKSNFTSPLLSVPFMSNMETACPVSGDRHTGTMSVTAPGAIATPAGWVDMSRIRPSMERATSRSVRMRSSESTILANRRDICLASARGLGSGDSSFRGMADFSSDTFSPLMGRPSNDSTRAASSKARLDAAVPNAEMPATLSAP